MYAAAPADALHPHEGRTSRAGLGMRPQTLAKVLLRCDARRDACNVCILRTLGDDPRRIVGNQRRPEVEFAQFAVVFPAKFPARDVSSLTLPMF